MKKYLLAIATLALWTGAANAATFTETLDLPDYGEEGPRVLQATRSFSTGTQLTEADEISNPSGWNNALIVIVDTTAQTITLRGDGDNNYQFIDIDITGVEGLTFSGFEAINAFGAVIPDASTFFTTSFTGSSLHITYSVAEPFGLFDITGDADSVFRYTLGSGAVPEPATWALLILGFGATGFAMRRARAPYAAAHLA